MVRTKFPEEECPKDYKKHHQWERRGIQNNKIIWQCSQCYICFEEHLRFTRHKTSHKD